MPRWGGSLALLGTLGDASPPPRIWDSISQHFTRELSSRAGSGSFTTCTAPALPALPPETAGPAISSGSQPGGFSAERAAPAQLGRAGKEEPSPICVPKPLESSSGEVQDVRDIARPRPEEEKNMLAASSPASPV